MGAGGEEDADTRGDRVVALDARQRRLVPQHGADQAEPLRPALMEKPAPFGKAPRLGGDNPVGGQSIGRRRQIQQGVRQRSILLRRSSAPDPRRSSTRFQSR